MEHLTWTEFERVELRAGTIIDVQEFPEARNPAYKVKVSFGELGEKWTSAQITKNYSKPDLIGKQIIGVLNFPKKQIANFMSEFLVTGFPDGRGGIILASVDQRVPDGARLI